ETSSISLLPSSISIISEEFTIPYYNKDYATITSNISNPGQKDATINVDIILKKTFSANLLLILRIMREEHGSYSLDGRPPIKRNMWVDVRYEGKGGFVTNGTGKRWGDRRVYPRDGRSTWRLELSSMLEAG
ncbi:hypothetical protein CBL_13338, partial [Carabus blaptoides fortunei]